MDPERLVSFSGRGESVADEACRLSRGPLTAILTQVRKVHKGEIDHESLAEWRNYQGIPLYLAEVAGELMVYAVEVLGRLDDFKISFMFAGTRVRGYRGAFGMWDGRDDDALDGVVRARCAEHFAPKEIP